VPPCDCWNVCYDKLKSERREKELRVVFNGRAVGYAYLEYIAHSEGQQTETILASQYGVVLKKWCLILTKIF